MVEFISQYQYPLIGLGILIIMGLVGYLADQKESGKIAEYKKERKSKLEEKKKIKEQQKAEKMKLQEEKKAEKLKLQEEKKKLKEQKAQEKAESKATKEENQVAVVPGEVSSEELVETSKNSEIIDDSMSNMEIIDSQEEVQTEESYMEAAAVPAMDIAIEEAASESTPTDVFVIEEQNASEDSIVMSSDNMTVEPESVSFEPTVQNEQPVDSFITESGEDLSVPFAFGDDNIVEETQTVDTLKSESSVAFNSLLEEVQAEEASLSSSYEEQFLQSMNTTTATPSTEEDDALKVFMQPAVSNNQSNDMTSDNLDEWKL